MSDTDRIGDRIALAHQLAELADTFTREATLSTPGGHAAHCRRAADELTELSRAALGAPDLTRFDAQLDEYQAQAALLERAHRPLPPATDKENP